MEGLKQVVPKFGHCMECRTMEFGVAAALNHIRDYRPFVNQVERVKPLQKGEACVRQPDRIATG